MLRAVEILANIFERQQPATATPPPPSDVPIVAFCEQLQFAVGSTARRDVERAFGIAFAYPAKGWHTYGVRSATGARIFASLFYSNDVLASVELYVPKADHAPNLTARDAHVRLVPGAIEVGAQLTTLPEHFGRIALPVIGRATYSDMFEARFPGGAAYAMGNNGTIERLALYVLRNAS